MQCPTPLGTGVTSKRAMRRADWRDPAAGIVITIPPHQGRREADVRPAQPSHLFRRADEGQARGIRAVHRGDRRADRRQHAHQPCCGAERVPFASKISSIVFRAAPAGRRQGGGAYRRGIDHDRDPDAENEVSMLGEKLIVDRADGSRRPTPSEGRPIAIVSNVMIEYRPAPPKPAPKAPLQKRPPGKRRPPPARARRGRQWLGWSSNTGKIRTPAPYLPDASASMDVHVMLEVTPSELGGLLARGWRRFGASYFRPACPSCTQCISTRIPAGQFVPDSQPAPCAPPRIEADTRRVRTVVDDERLALYKRWHTQRESRRGWAASPLDAERYASDFAFAPIHRFAKWVFAIRQTTESARRARDRPDVVPGALSAVFIFLGSRARAALAWRRAHRMVDRGRGEARARPCVSGLPRGRVPVAGLQGALPSAGVARGAAGAGRCSGVETFGGDRRAPVR